MRLKNLIISLVLSIIFILIARARWVESLASAVAKSWEQTIVSKSSVFLLVVGLLSLCFSLLLVRLVADEAKPIKDKKWRFGLRNFFIVLSIAAPITLVDLGSQAFIQPFVSEIFPNQTH